MAKPDSTLARSLSLITGDDLVARIRQKLETFEKSRALAVSACRHTVDRAIELGELFDEAAARFPGNYEEWCSAHFPGISKMTAWRFRQCWQQRDRILGDPELATLKDAYVRLGLLPPPAPTDEAPPREPSLYTIKLSIDEGKPIDTWSPLDLREFLDQTARIADLRAQAESRLLALGLP